MPGQCPRCKKQVYFAEEKIVLGKPYHKMCVKCGHCNKQVDSGSVTDHQDEIYCKSCYGRLFGPKGYGYGIGAGVLSMDDGSSYQNGPPRSNVPSTLEAYIAPLKNSNGVSVTAAGSKEETTTKEVTTTITTNSSITNNNSGGNARAAAVTSTTNPANRPVHTPLPANTPKWGGGTYCTRCNKSVFMAERLMAAGGAWHKACFTCQECNKRLDSHSIREHDRNIYCNPCYGKNFGPKGFWGWSSAKVS